MTYNPTEDTQNDHRRLTKADKKAVARAMIEDAERQINEIRRYTNNVFRLVIKMRIDSTDVFGGRCI